MSLKSIRESYSKFLTALNDAGVKLDESQKGNLDSFIIAIESKMTKQKEAAVKATKKIVTEHLEKEYKKVFESIMSHMQENSELAAKVQEKISSIKESKKIADKVSNYLDLYVESVLPKKTILDYDRMQKLESLHESLKDLLVVNEDAVESKKAALQESFNKDKKALETEIAKLQVKLNESMAKTQKLNKKIDSFKAMELLDSKTKDLPDYEARQMKKRLAEASTVEIEKTFSKVLESVKEEMKEAELEEETSIEEEVKDIIECDGEDVKENDILKNRKHNAHVDEAEDVKENDLLKGRTHNAHVDEAEDKEVDEAEDDVELDESYVIDSNLMKWFCDKAATINTDIVRA